MPPDGERPQSDLTLRAEYYSAFKKWEILARVRNLADGVLVKSARLRRAEAASYTGRRRRRCSEKQSRRECAPGDGARSVGGTAGAQPVPRREGEMGQVGGASACLVGVSLIVMPSRTSKAVGRRP